MLLGEGGVAASYESVRHWCLKFSQNFAAKLRRRGLGWAILANWTRSLCESAASGITSGAVDQHDVVLGILVQDRRNATAAKRFCKHPLLASQHKPRRLITDDLQRFEVARREMLPDVRLRNSRYLNGGAENSQRATRRRARQMQRFNHPSRYSHSCRRTESSTATSAHDVNDSRLLLVCLSQNLPDLATSDVRPDHGIKHCALPLATHGVHFRRHGNAGVHLQ